MKIDQEMMWKAISGGAEAQGFPEHKAFLNRNTGEILFLYDREGEVEAFYGMGEAIESVGDRACRDASPDDWLVIPKYDRRVMGDYNEDAFIHRFLHEHGIEVGW